MLLCLFAALRPGKGLLGVEAESSTEIEIEAVPVVCTPSERFENLTATEATGSFESDWESPGFMHGKD